MGGLLLPAAGCQNSSAYEEDSPQAESSSNPIVGAWDLVYGEYTNLDGETTIRQNEGSFQLKIFSDKHFSLLMRAEDSSYIGVTGMYQLDGNKYIETFDWISLDTPAMNAFAGGGKYIYEWRIEGDTLIKMGPEAYNNKGEKVERGQVLEKRIRAQDRVY